MTTRAIHVAQVGGEGLPVSLLSQWMNRLTLITPREQKRGPVPNEIALPDSFRDNDQLVVQVRERRSGLLQRDRADLL
jgi:hypothetical protein